jgi:hypothetical protein
VYQMAELAGKTTLIKISGAATTMTAEATTTTDNQNYQITSTTKQVLDRDTAPTVLDDGVETEEDYTVNYLNGKITFTTVDAGRGPITVTGKYLPMTTAAYAHSMTKNTGADIHDVTPFQSTHKKRKAGLLFQSGTLSQFNVIDATYAAALQAGNPIVIEDRDTATSEPNRVWALLDSVQIAGAIAGVQDMPVSWISHDAWLKLGG